jgi:hypothetical protein
MHPLTLPPAPYPCTPSPSPALSAPHTHTFCPLTYRRQAWQAFMLMLSAWLLSAALALALML